MYGLVRVLLGIIALLLISRLKSNFKGNTYLPFKKIGIILLSFVLIIVLCLFPVENLFVTFSTPEKAYSYLKNKEIDLVVNGNASSLIVASDGDTLIVPKYNNRWKLGSSIDSVKVYESIDKGFHVVIFQYKETEELYIIVSGISSDISVVKDNLGTKFIKRKDTNIYYAYINQYNNYEITLNTDVIINIGDTCNTGDNSLNK